MTDTVDIQVGGVSLPMSELANGSHVVLDFWTLACQRCPAALAKLNALAAKDEMCTRFIAVNLDEDHDMAKTVLEDGGLSNLECGWCDRHSARSCLDIRTVPYYVILRPDGRVLVRGTAVNVASELAAIRAAELLERDRLADERAAADRVFAFDAEF